MLFIYFVSSIMALILIAGLIFFFVIKFKKSDKPKDGDIIINLKPQFTDGAYLGIIDKKTYGDKRIGVEFYPFYKKDKKKKKQLVFFEESKLLPVTFNSEINIWVGLPTNEEDMPEQMKKEILGKSFMSLVSNKNQIRDESGILRNAIKNQNEMLNQTIGQEIYKDTKGAYQNVISDIMRIANGEKIPKKDEK